MLKYYKEFIAKYDFADVLQTTSLIFFVVFFSALMWYVFSRPKGYYEEVSQLPLEQDLEESNNE